MLYYNFKISIFILLLHLIYCGSSTPAVFLLTISPLHWNRWPLRQLGSAAHNPGACRTTLGSSADAALSISWAGHSRRSAALSSESRRIYGIRNKLALYEAAIKHEIWAETSLWEKRATLLISGANWIIRRLAWFGTFCHPEETRTERRELAAVFYCVRRTSFSGKTVYVAVDFQPLWCLLEILKTNF